MIHSCSINHKVIERDLHEHGDELVEKIDDDAFERSWGGLRSERHDYGHENALICYEGSFLLVF